jgi:hypothetical protein
MEENISQTFAWMDMNNGNCPQPYILTWYLRKSYCHATFFVVLVTPDLTAHETARGLSQKLILRETYMSVWVGMHAVIQPMTQILIMRLCRDIAARTKLKKYVASIAVWCCIFRSREIEINGRGNSLRWPRNTLYPPKLALTSPTSGSRSVSIVRLRTKAMERELCCISISHGNKWLFTNIYVLLFFTCVSFDDAVSISEYIASNDGMVNEWWRRTGDDMLGSGRGLIWDVIPEFSSGDWGKPRTFFVGVPAVILTGTFWIRVTSVTAWATLFHNLVSLLYRSTKTRKNVHGIMCLETFNLSVTAERILPRTIHLVLSTLMAHIFVVGW